MALVAEWLAEAIRRKDDGFSHEIKDYLFTSKSFEKDAHGH